MEKMIVEMEVTSPRHLAAERRVPMLESVLSNTYPVNWLSTPAFQWLNFAMERNIVLVELTREAVVPEICVQPIGLAALSSVIIVQTVRFAHVLSESSS